MSTLNKTGRVVMITPYPNLDNLHAKNTGVGSYSYYLCTALAKEGMDIEVWSQKGEGLLEYVDTIDGSNNKITVKRVWSKNIDGLFSLIKMIWHKKPKVLHIQHEFSIFGGAFSAVLSPLLPIFARVLGVKVVTTMHGGFGLDQIDSSFIKENGYNIPPFMVKLAFIFIFGLIAHSSNKIIVHEHFQKDELVDGYFVSSDKILVIPHGVPDQVEILEKSRAREILKIGNEYNKVFLYMGFAARYKGLPEMLTAYKDYIKSNSNSLLILGAGPMPRLAEDAEYMRWYNNLKFEYEGLGDSVKWVGFIDSYDIAKYYSAADAIVFPYSRRLAASGPMAIAIGYEKDIILSSILSGNKYYNFNFNNFLKTVEIKKQRVWSEIAVKVSEIYKS